MWPWLERIASACWDRVRRYALTRKGEDDDAEDDAGGGADELLWSRDLARHAAGEFSFAVVQANDVLEDHSQVETAAAATFVGVYDGHGGAEASRFISNHLSSHIVRTCPPSPYDSNKFVLREMLTSLEWLFGSIVLY
jgi:pyruvate dehydrogenase phosphatase